MRRMAAFALGSTILLTACGGGAETAAPLPSDEVEAPEPTATPEPTVPATTAGAPEDLALTDTDVLLRGDTGALVAPGESVRIEHLAYNGAQGSRSFRFQVVRSDLDVETSISSLRLSAGESVLVASSVTIPEDAAVGDVFTFEVVAVMSDDLSQRAAVEVRLLVADPAGTRPTVNDAEAETETNEKVIVYLFGAARDADNDLDVASLRVVGGGFRSADIVAGSDGTITYFPFQNVTGRDRVLFEICDSEGRCDTGTLTIDVNG